MRLHDHIANLAFVSIIVGLYNLIISMKSAGLQTANTSFIRNQLPVPNAAYAPSKIAVHWLTKKINAEEDKVAAFVIHPG